MARKRKVIAAVHGRTQIDTVSIPFRWACTNEAFRAGIADYRKGVWNADEWARRYIKPQGPGERRYDASWFYERGRLLAAADPVVRASSSYNVLGPAYNAAFQRRDVI